MRILIDCDGVLANFTKACLDYINTCTGEQYAESDVTQHDIFAAVGQSHLRNDFMEDCAWRYGFCMGIEPYADIRKHVEELRKLGHVICVTAPLLGIPRWHHERTVWLGKHAGFPHQDVIFSQQKQCVSGDVFIDDNPDNCQAWQAHNSGGLTILWDMPYNMDFDCQGTRIVRIGDWESLIGAVALRMGNYGP